MNTIEHTDTINLSPDTVARTATERHEPQPAHESAVERTHTDTARLHTDARQTVRQSDTAAVVAPQPTAVEPSAYVADTLGARQDSTSATLADSLLHSRMKAKADSMALAEYMESRPTLDVGNYNLRPGEAGSPVPYSIGGDNIVMALLLACLICGTIGLSKSRDFMARQARLFFRATREDTIAATETGTELRFQAALMLQTCLLLAVVAFYHMHDAAVDQFVVDHHLVIGAFFVVAVAYVALKMLVQWTCGLVFFSKRRNEAWMKSYMFIMTLEGVVLLPVVMLQCNAAMSAEGALAMTAIVVIMSKMLSFYKIYNIFFKHMGAFVQFFLYFCALEIMPVFALLGFLGMTSDYLKVNF